MSHVEARKVLAPSGRPVRDDGKVGERPGPEAESAYDSLPLGPTRAVVVTVRRVGKIAPRAHQALAVEQD